MTSVVDSLLDEAGDFEYDDTWYNFDLAMTPIGKKEHSSVSTTTTPDFLGASRICP